MIGWHQSPFALASVRAPAFHVPAFQGNHSKKAVTFSPGTQVRSFVTHDARCPRYQSLTDVRSMTFTCVHSPRFAQCRSCLATGSLHDLAVAPSFVQDARCPRYSSLHCVAFNTFTPFSTGSLFHSFNTARYALYSSLHCVPFNVTPLRSAQCRSSVATTLAPLRSAHCLAATQRAPVAHAIPITLLDRKDASKIVKTRQKP